MQVLAKELARDVEYSRPFGALHLGSAAGYSRTCIRNGPATSSRSVRLKKVCGHPSTRGVTSRPLALQGVVEEDALVMRHGAVGEAVHDKEWRRVLPDVGDRAGGATRSGNALDGRTDQPRLW